MKTNSGNHINVFLLLFLLLLPSVCASAADKDDRAVVLLETSMGDIRIALSNLTPMHRDNFIRLVEKGFYDGLLFSSCHKGFYGTDR